MEGEDDPRHTKRPSGKQLIDLVFGPNAVAQFDGVPPPAPRAGALFGLRFITGVGLHLTPPLLAQAAKGDA